MIVSLLLAAQAAVPVPPGSGAPNYEYRCTLHTAAGKAFRVKGRTRYLGFEAGLRGVSIDVESKDSRYPSVAGSAQRALPHQAVMAFAQMGASKRYRWDLQLPKDAIEQNAYMTLFEFESTPGKPVSARYIAAGLCDLLPGKN